MTTERGATTFMRTPPKQTLERFGKLGILVDELAASNRLARQLYGTERLPYWWVLAETVQDATKLVAQALQWVGEADGLVVVLERYVQITGKGVGEAWDLSTDAAATKFRAEVGRLLQAADKHATTHVAFRTSFPHRPSRAQTKSLPWRRHTPESGSTLRADLREKMTGFLRFGPEPRADPGWAGLVSHCASLLALPRRSRSVVLLTGEEFVQPEHAHSPGIPPWADLRDRALSHSPHASYHKLDALRSMTAPDLRRIEAVQMEHEQTFPYKAWLAVRLPWTWIMSFGTDSCLQRAASAYSAYAGPVPYSRREREWDNAVRDRALRFRRSFDLMGEDASPLDSSLFPQHGLFQPHRGLLKQIRRPGAEATSLARALDPLAPESGTFHMVMLGLSLHRTDRKEALEQALHRLQERGLTVSEHVSATWVHSMAEEQMSVQKENRRLLRSLMTASETRQEGGGPNRTNAIPFTPGHGPLDFLYDVTLAVDALPNFARALYDAYCDDKQALPRKALELGVSGDWQGEDDRTLATLALDAQDQVDLAQARSWLTELAPVSTAAAESLRMLPDAFDGYIALGSDNDRLPQLAHLLTEHFDARDLRSMAHDLGFGNHMPEGASKSQLADELALGARQRGDISTLLDLVEGRRPNIQQTVAALRLQFP